LQRFVCHQRTSSGKWSRDVTLWRELLYSLSWGVATRLFPNYFRPCWNWPKRTGGGWDVEM